MAVINPDHLFDQAKSLITPSSGRPREADLRRAVSAAYYGLFHAISNAAAEYVVGRAGQGTPQYALVYRSINHGRLADVCGALTKRPVPAKLKPYQPPGGFSSQIRLLCDAVDVLQKQRHAADYDPLLRIGKSDASLAISTAHSAVDGFHSASTDDRICFLLLVLFGPR